MNIQEKINVDLKNSILNKNDNEKSLLRVIIGEFNRIGKDCSDEQCIKILKKMMENAKLLNNQIEIDILVKYLPKELNSDELEILIHQIISNNSITSIKEMGKVMAELKKSGNIYDGKIASDIIKKLLK
jgi:uncharacterized protein YqeY